MASPVVRKYPGPRFASHELEAGDLADEETAPIEAHARTGRPRGSEAFVTMLEAQTGRRLKRRKPGPRPKGGE